MQGHAIEPSDFSIDDVQSILNSGSKLYLSENSKQLINKGRSFLEKKLLESTSPIYGINTGFGSLCDVEINKNDLEKLQENLVVSHACGTGDFVPEHISKLMLLLKIKSLSLGYSGVRLELVERLVVLFNEGIIPVIFQQGSLGASGDLAPLAHMSLPLIGKGHVWMNGIKRTSEEALEILGIEPLTLKSKEGLALLNGTQFMNAYGISLCIKGQKLIQWATTIAAISLEAFDGRIEPFFPQLHTIRNHDGQQKIAANMLELLEGSEIAKQTKKHVQDPYSFRCIPQVLGASLDVLSYVSSIFVKEMNAVTDNPTVFPDDEMIISGGNFHGQPLAMALDYLCLALHEVGSISERRTYQLISGRRNLPPFLVANPGLNSGLMIPQYTAASIVSQNKQYCTPASSDTIDSSNGQEDHVSMGANAATKAWKVLENLETILAIELLNASQAIAFREPAKSSAAITRLLESYRKSVPFIDNDRFLSPEIEKSKSFISSYNLSSEL
jgi:histidine ammonia-lyase